MNRRIPLYSALLFATAAVCAAVIVSGLFFNSRFGAVAQKAAAVERLLDQVFVEAYDKTAASDAAAAAMIASTGDPWSYYIPASAYEAYLENASNSYTGIGIVLEMREGDPALRVAAVTSGGPAEMAGMLPGDILVSVDGTSLSGMDVTQVRDMIRAGNGRDLSILVDRNGTSLEMTVVCGTVQTEVAVSAMLGDGIGYIRIYNFEANCCRQTLDCISELLQQGAKGLVFDVRSNPGGKRTELVEVLDYLLPEGDLFRSTDHDGKELVDRSDEICLRLPMAVLVNEYSFSAAEFFAAALQEYDWAEVIGTKTVGKGNYQIVYSFSDGSACGISSGRYFTPSGKSLEGTGIAPDVEVAMDPSLISTVENSTVLPGEDTQLAAAVDAVRKNLLQK